MIKLKRSYTNGATLGIIVDEKESVLVKTLELPYEDNQKEISCIPEGTYKITEHLSPKFGNCLKINDVPDRTDILIHCGNWIHDTKGCILVGTSYQFDDYDIENGITLLSSKDALKILMNYVGKECMLKVEEDYAKLY
jgi:hypothetical protein